MLVKKYSKNNIFLFNKIIFIFKRYKGEGKFMKEVW